MTLQLDETTTDRIVAGILDNNGATVSTTGAPTPTHGYAVALAGYEHVTRWSEFTYAEVSDYLDRHRDILALPDVYAGAWVDDGRIYLDVTLVIEDPLEAIEAGRANQQLAIFNLDTGESVELVAS